MRPTPAQLEREIARRTFRLDEEWLALEELLNLAQWYDGTLDARLLALPDRMFARAVIMLGRLGWINR
jgi:hypothetical protein